MKKKSLFTLFTCLVIGGLSLVGSANAMTYTVSGSSTQITIPNDIYNTTIKWCSSCTGEILSNELSNDLTNCTSMNDPFPGLKCYHIYNDTGTYEITYDGKNKILDNLSLNNANVVNIKDFNDIALISNLYINNNTGISFNSNQNPFQSKNISTIYLNNNGLTSFEIDVPYNSNTKLLYLKDNELTTIPEKIRRKRGLGSYEYTIKLSEDVSYPKNSNNINTIDLSRNQINFIGITEINSTDTSDCTYSNYDCDFKDTTEYNFEWFAYSYNTNEPLNYQYEILDSNNNQVSGTYNTTTGGGITISQALAPGYYTFKVCYNEENNNSKDEHCDDINFRISYYLGIDLKGNISSGGTITGLNDGISFYRDKVGNYPDEFINQFDKYYIELKKNNSETIYTGTTDNFSSFTFDDNIKNKLNNNSNYTFYVYILDLNGDKIDADGTYTINCSNWNDYWDSCSEVGPDGEIYASRTFTVAIPDDPATLSITSPIGNVSTPTTTFNWDHSLPTGNTFLNYTYSVKQGTSTIKTGKFTTEDTNSFTLTGLTDGSYTFSITMNYSGHSGTTGINTSSDFTMTAGNGKYLNITSPTSGQKFSPTGAKVARINFKWNGGGSSLISGYYYTVTSGNSIIHSGYINKNTSGSYVTGGDLSNGTYTFNVQMLNNEGNIMKTGSVHFYVNIPSTLTINTPTIQLNSASINRNGFTPYEFLKYTYKLSGSTLTNPITGESNNETGDSIEYTDLRDGTYTFSIDMLYRIGSTTGYVTGTKVFTINSNSGAYLNITSPISGSQTTRNVQFSWNGGNAPSFKQYSYEIKSGTNIIYSGYTTGTSFTRALSDGTYTFTVKMLDNGGNIINSLVKSSRFTVRAAVSLEILSPTSGLQNSNTIDFIWSGDAETFGYFDYTVSKVNGLPVAIKYGTGDINFRSFTISNLHHGVYQFTVEIKSTSNTILATQTRPFYILDDLDLILNISSDNASIPASGTIRSRTGTFSWDGKSEDLSGFFYSVEGTTFSGDSYIYTGIQFGTSGGNFTLTGLQSGKYRFTVRMLDTDSGVITGKTMDFNVQIPARLKITSPASGSTITSSSYTFNWTGYSDIISGYEYKLTKSGDTQTGTNTFTTNNSFSTNLSNGEYTLNVRISSGGQLVAHDSTSFTVAIKKSSGGGGGGSSSNSHRTNDLSVSVTNKEPTTNEWVEVVVDINDKYSGKVDFTKMQYYSPDEEKRIDIPVTSKNYVSDYSDDAKLGYVKFDSNDDGEKQLSQFLKFSENGNYRIYVQDKDGYRDYVQFYIGKGNKAQLTSTPTKESNNDEYYIARSCKKYKLEYIDDLGVRTSPNLKMNEYFINKDYFKRYIDSKNKQIDGCPTNVGWISTTYSDKSNSSKQYAAPNGKVYFISQENGSYSSKELNKELNGTKNFSSINNLKYFIRDRNHFLNMTLPVK